MRNDHSYGSLRNLTDTRYSHRTTITPRSPTIARRERVAWPRLFAIHWWFGGIVYHACADGPRLPPAVRPSDSSASVRPISQGERRFALGHSCGPTVSVQELPSALIRLQMCTDLAQMISPRVLPNDSSLSSACLASSTDTRAYSASSALSCTTLAKASRKCLCAAICA